MVTAGKRPDILTAKKSQLWTRRFRSGNFVVHNAPLFEKPVVENLDKIMGILETDRHTSMVLISQKQEIAHKSIWNQLIKRVSMYSCHMSKREKLQ